MVSATAAAGAAQDHPGGMALSQLVEKGAETPEEHLEKALQLGLTGALIRLARGPKVARSVPNRAQAPKVLMGRRASAFADLTALPAKLSHFRAQRVEVLPADSPANGINFPLAKSLAASLSFPGAELVSDLCLGVPIVGTSPRAVRWPPGLGLLPQACQSGEHRRLCVTASLRNNSATKATRLWCASVGGKRSPILSADGFQPRNRPLKQRWIRNPLTPRFAIPGHHVGATTQNFRAIDDFRVSGISSILTTQDASIPGNLDSFHVGAQQIKAIAPGCVAKAFAVDFANAYKLLPLLGGHQDFATIALEDPEGSVCQATLKTQPFGSRRAPANWGSLTAFAKWIALHLFDCVVRIFADDCFVVEPEATIFSAFASLLSARGLLGLEISATKTIMPTADLLLLGAQAKLRFS